MDFFYKNKIVAVVGGGDTAVEETLYLSKIVKKVYLIHRRDKLRSNQMLSNKLMHKSKAENSNIEIIWNTTIEDIEGSKNDGVTGLILKNKHDDKRSKIDVDGLFVAIGHIPNSEIFKDKLEMFETGHIKINMNENRITETSKKGVFAAGDVTDSKYKQAISAAGYGCMAAIDAEKYIEEEL
jgi:thioredoxin reductase (NADPH)